MLFRKHSVRRKRQDLGHIADTSNRRLELESLECRRLLSGDGIAPDPSALIAAGGFVSGTKWEDINRNSVREANEPGLAGVTIYADMNNNGVLDANEPSAVTQKGDPDTRFDEAGRYELFVPPGKHTIREVVPRGFTQTFPLQHVIDLPEIRPADDAFSTVEPPFLEISAEPGDVFQTEVAITIHPLCVRAYELDVVALSANGEPGVDVISHSGPITNGCGGDTSVFAVDIFAHDGQIREFEIGFMDLMTGEIIATIPVSLDHGGGHVSGGHAVKIEHGDRVDGLDFGNARVRPVGGSIEGRKWLDRDGDGEQDPGEPGLGGVTIYIDANNNGEWNRGEPSTITQFDDPITDFDEGGLYHFGKVEAGVHIVREVVPQGYAQTFPLVAADVISSDTGEFTPQHAFDFDVTDVKYTTTDAATTTTIELSASWSNGCGQLSAQADHTVIGNTIIVDANGKQEGDICTLATKTDTVEVAIQGLSAGIYSVVGTLHEERGPSLGVVGTMEIGANGAHTVKVEPGSVVSEINFGNRRTGRGESISGTKWNDKNGDGFRQRGEPGLGGVTIYVDMNNNRVLDDDEPSTVSSSNPNNLGTYEIAGLEPGNYYIREIVPEGYRQTAPSVWLFDPDVEPVDPEIVGEDGQLIDPFPGRPIFFGDGAHFVQLVPGSHLEGLDFGNQSTDPGAISGTKWNDRNGNGFRDQGEEGMAGVTIYVDSNYSRTLDEGELSAVTGADGSYTIKGIRPGNYSIQEVVPDGYRQTFPADGFWFDTGQVDPAELRIAPPFGGHHVNIVPNEVLEGIDFGNQKVEAGSISGLKWLDENGNGVRDRGEVGLAGVTIYVDLNYSGSHEENEPFAVSQKDDPATEVDEAGQYTISGLKPFNSYAVRELVPEGYEQTFPSNGDWFVPPFDFLDQPELVPDIDWGDIAVPFPIDFHSVFVGSGQQVDDINFGNRKIAEPGFISGSKWEDLNGNGTRDEGERGLPGFTIFVDSNLNGERDFAEPFAVTERDNPNTAEDESGHYTLKVRPGSYLVLEQQQRGYEQTHPNPARRIMHPFNLGHSVDVAAGSTVGNIDFGNQPLPAFPAVISGTKWFDSNANGVRDRGEEPMSGVTIYLDANDNGRFDEGERSTVTGSQFELWDDDGFGFVPFPFPQDGYYSFDVKPGDYVVREVIPRGYIQTYPFGSYELGESFANPLGGGSAEGLEFVSIETATTSQNDSGQSETVMTFETVWAAGEVEVYPSQVVVNDNNITVHLTAFAPDPNSNVQTVQRTAVNVGALNFGDYHVRVELSEEFLFGPDDRVDDPFAGPIYELESKFSYQGDDAHRVSVHSGEFVSGLDFGNIAVPTTNNGGADSRMGDDPHSETHDDSATQVEFHDGHLRLNSYVDSDDDRDVFRFVGKGGEIVGEGGRMDGSADLTYELIDGQGNTLATATMGEPIQARTNPGETYYLRVAGGQGQYQLDLFEEATDAESLDPLPGDTNGDRKVDFADFLTLSANFGNEVDEAFADGDFDNDDVVTFADFLVLSGNFGKSA